MQAARRSRRLRRSALGLLESVAPPTAGISDQSEADRPQGRCAIRRSRCSNAVAPTGVRWRGFQIPRRALRRLEILRGESKRGGGPGSECTSATGPGSDPSAEDAALTYVSDAEGLVPIGAVVNASAVGSGSLALTMASSSGFVGQVPLRKITFRTAATTSITGSLVMLPTEIRAAGSFSDLLLSTVTASYPLIIR